MKKIVLAALGLTFAATTAFAADLPSRRAAPVAPVTTSEVDPNAVTGFYLGGGAGYGFNGKNYDLNLRGGYDFGYFRNELSYDYLNKRGGTATNLLMDNVILEYTSGRLTPFLLAGAGVAFEKGSFDTRVPVYDIGGGVRYSLTSWADAELRYRYVDTIAKTTAPGEHLVTAGVNVRF